MDGIELAAGVGEAPVAQRPRIVLQPHRALPWLALPEGLSLQVLIDVAPVRVPNTRLWFHGVLSQRGNLMPIFDLGHWAGFEPIGTQKTQLVSVGQGSHAYALHSVASPTLVLTGGEPIQMPDTGALAPFLGAATLGPDGAVCEFDAHRWLAAAALQIGEGGPRGA